MFKLLSVQFMFFCVVVERGGVILNMYVLYLKDIFIFSFYL